MREPAAKCVENLYYTSKGTTKLHFINQLPKFQEVGPVFVIPGGTIWQSKIPVGTYVGDSMSSHQMGSTTLSHFVLIQSVKVSNFSRIFPI